MRVHSVIQCCIKFGCWPSWIDEINIFSCLKVADIKKLASKCDFDLQNKCEHAVLVLYANLNARQARHHTMKQHLQKPVTPCRKCLTNLYAGIEFTCWQRLSVLFLLNVILALALTKVVLLCFYDAHFPEVWCTLTIAVSTEQCTDSIWWVLVTQFLLEPNPVGHSLAFVSHH